MKVNKIAVNPIFTKVYECPKCPWTRTYSMDPQIWHRKWQHPLYGTVTGQSMVRLDIKEHDCTASLIAHEKSVQRYRLSAGE